MSTKHTWGQALWTWGLVSWLAGAMAIGCGGGGEDPPTFATWSVTATPTAAARVEIGGEAYVSVPVGAVDEVTEIRIAEIALATPPAGAAMVSVPLRFEPEGKTFLQPVDIAITVSTSGLPAGSSIDDVVVLRAPAGTGQFVPIPTAVGSPTIVIAQTDHFSDFVAVVWTGAPPACGNGMCNAPEACGSCPYDCGLCIGTGAVTLETFVADFEAWMHEESVACYGGGVDPATVAVDKYPSDVVDYYFDRDHIESARWQIDLPRASRLLAEIDAWPDCAVNFASAWVYLSAATIRGFANFDSGWGIRLGNPGDACEDSGQCRLGLHCESPIDASPCAGTCQAIAAAPLGGRCRSHSDCADVATSGSVVVCAPDGSGDSTCQMQNAPSVLALGAPCQNGLGEQLRLGRLPAGCGPGVACVEGVSGVVDGTFTTDAGTCQPYYLATGSPCTPAEEGRCGWFASCLETAPSSGTYACYGNVQTTTVGGPCDDFTTVTGRGIRSCAPGMACVAGSCQGGSTCLDSWDCPGGSSCSSHFAFDVLPFQCVTRFGNGQACDTQRQCQSNYCDEMTGLCADYPFAPAVGSPESCNGLDDDCDGTIDDGLAQVSVFNDADVDGYGDVAVTWCGPTLGLVAVGGDCAADDSRVNPGAAEVLGDGLDNDCNVSTPD